VPTPPIILGEGGADEAFINCLIKVKKLGSFEFRTPHEEKKQRWGKDGFRTRLKALVGEGGILERSAVIIVADNDSDPDEAFKGIQGEIKMAGLQPPDAVQTKTKATEEFPALSVLMIPSAAEKGCLETLLLTSAAEKYKEQIKCVTDFVGCVQATNWEVSDLAKLKMRCLLSALYEENPCISLTVALLKDGETLFPLGHEIFQPIADFLTEFAV
jgi:hypothetical protein